MKKFEYNVRFHVADNAATYAHWDEMIVTADCVSNARYNAVVRIMNEFDYSFESVDVLEIYTKSGSLVLREIK